MPRPNSGMVVAQMLRIMRYLNDRAPSDPTKPGDAITIADLADELAMEPVEVRRRLRMLSDCGDALRGYFVDYDEESDLVTPWRMDMAIDQTVGLTARETCALLTALDILGFAADDPLRAKLRDAVPSLTADLVRGMQTQVAQEGLSDTLSQISRGISQGVALKVRYRGAQDSEPVERVIDPISLTYDQKECGWYLTAWCHMRQAWRIFRCERLSEVTATTQPVSLHRQPHTPPDMDKRISEARQARLMIHDPQTMGEIRSWRGLKCTEGQTLQPESIAVIPWVEGSPWLARKVMATLGGVEVLDPPELRQAVTNEAERVLALISSSDDLRNC